MKKEFKVIADLLPNGTRVLDVGCGDGSLMDLLTKYLLYKSQSKPGNRPTREASCALKKKFFSKKKNNC